MRLTKRLQNFGKQLEALVFSHWYTLALACALLAAAIFLVWLCACGAKKDALTTAQEMIGEDISSLTAAIGEPDNSSYASSCLGPGEDGELYYDGFTVYTYRDPDGTENVYDVMPQQ